MLWLWFFSLKRGNDISNEDWNPFYLYLLRYSSSLKHVEFKSNAVFRLFVAQRIPKNICRNARFVWMLIVSNWVLSARDKWKYWVLGIRVKGGSVEIQGFRWTWPNVSWECLWSFRGLTEINCRIGKKIVGYIYIIWKIHKISCCSILPRIGYHT